MFLVEEEDETRVGGNLSSIGDFIDLGGSEETNEEVKISLQATGSPNPRTMRIQIRISNKLFMALVDAGSTYNFMHLRVARRLGLASRWVGTSWFWEYILVEGVMPYTIGFCNSDDGGDKLQVKGIGVQDSEVD